MHTSDTPLLRMPIPSISVVMPVFNAASTLADTLNSILQQSFKNWELIAVNDGSTDDSLEILEYYAAQDHRIRIINKINGGAAAARNMGMEQARGTWVLFHDSDDIAHLDMLQKLLEAATDNDISMIAGGICEIRSHNKIVINPPVAQGITQGQKHVTPAVAARFLFAGPWCKLFRRAIIEQHGLRFPEELHNAEDLIFNLRFLVFSNNIALVHEGLMDYIIRPNSLYASLFKKAHKSQYYIHLIKTMAEVANLIPSAWTRSRRREFGKGIAYRYFSELSLIWSIYSVRKQAGGIRTLLRCLISSLPGLMRNATPEAVLKVFIHCLKARRFQIIREYLLEQMEERK